MADTSWIRESLDAELKSAASRVSFAESNDEPVRVTFAAAPEPVPPSPPPSEAPPRIETEPHVDRKPLWKDRNAWAGGFGSVLFHASLLVGFVAFANWMTDVTNANVHEAIRATLGDEEIVDNDAFTPIAEVPAFELAPSQSAVERPQDFLAPVNRSDLEGMFAANQFAPALSSDGDSEDGADQADGRGLRFAKPTSGRAVTKGSFTAWTEPADPQPNQDYYIVLQIRVPKRIDEFPKSDLRIEVKGTDNFHLKLPDPRYRFFRPGNLKIVDGEAQLVLWIPGADANVRDAIRIESVKILKETQILEITF